MQKLIDVLGERYGPYAFGLVSLLVVWFAIVSPELSRNRIEYDEHRKLVELMREAVSQQNNVAVAMESTARILDLTTTRLERLLNDK